MMARAAARAHLERDRIKAEARRIFMIGKARRTGHAPRRSRCRRVIKRDARRSLEVGSAPREQHGDDGDELENVRPWAVVRGTHPATTRVFRHRTRSREHAACHRCSCSFAAHSVRFGRRITQTRKFSTKSANGACRLTQHCCPSCWGRFMHCTSIQATHEMQQAIPIMTDTFLTHWHLSPRPPREKFDCTGRRRHVPGHLPNWASKVESQPSPFGTLPIANKPI